MGVLAGLLCPWLPLELAELGELALLLDVLLLEELEELDWLDELDELDGLDWLDDGELLDELLDDELLGDGGGLLGVGKEGVCGVVGLLALGQPVSSTQLTVAPTSSLSAARFLRSGFRPPEFDPPEFE